MKKKKIKDVSALSLFSNTQIADIISDINQPKMYHEVVSTVSDLHKVFNKGISVMMLAGLPPDDSFPYASGMLIHLQRLAKGQASTSQHIHHVFFDLDNNSIYYRKGRGNGTTVPMGGWYRINTTYL